MANTFVAPFAQKFKLVTAIVTAASGGIGTSTVTGLQPIATGGANGSLITRITALPRATATASSLILFIAKAATPAVFVMVDSELMAAYTLATTTAIPETTFGNITSSVGIPLEQGDVLYVGSQVALAAGIAFSAWQADL
ncbi:hypothetical protein AABC73_20480 [Pseudomonas sp. G.S.17]|uniref:hypothetical protein n=1 Tax=Pseudomonas sp. G.S.17 TaxID=3137451 RepID=UPI00311CDFD6